MENEPIVPDYTVDFNNCGKTVWVSTKPKHKMYFFQYMDKRRRLVEVRSYKIWRLKIKLFFRKLVGLIPTKKLLVVFGLLVSSVAFSQVKTLYVDKNRVVTDHRLPATYEFKIPQSLDTASAIYPARFTGIALFTTSDSSYWIRNQTHNRWLKICPGKSPIN